MPFRPIDRQLSDAANVDLVFRRNVLSGLSLRLRAVPASASTIAHVPSFLKPPPSCPSNIEPALSTRFPLEGITCRRRRVKQFSPRIVQNTGDGMSV